MINNLDIHGNTVQNHIWFGVARLGQQIQQLQVKVAHTKQTDDDVTVANDCYVMISWNG